MAAEHAIAVNLEAPDIRAAYERGEYPRSGWEQAGVAQARDHADQLTRGLRGAFWATLAFAALGLVLAGAFGKIEPSMPFSASKVLSLAGGLLAAWATLFELGGYAATYKGQALHELLHPALFKAIFLPGIAIAALGQVW